MPNIQPELTIYAANGYNARDGNFLGAPVFTLTYTKEKTVAWRPDGNIAIPDQLSASASTSAYSASRTVLMESKADYDRVYSASVEAQFSGVTYSGSINSSLMYHGNLFSSTSSSYALNQYLQSILAFERLKFTASGLDAEFVAALQSLPLAIGTAEAQLQYFSFFDQYGTHYAESATVGGVIVMETAIDDSLLERYSALEISAAVSVGYDGLVSSGSIKASAAYDASSFLHDHRNQIQILTTTLGGLFAADEKMSNWQTSLYGSPRLLLNVPGLTGGQRLTRLQCISKLVSTAGAAAVIAGNIEALLHAYTTPLFGTDGLLASPADVNPNTVVQVDSGDGFLLATLSQGANGDRAHIRAYDDRSGDPSTLRACASQHFYLNHDHQIPTASFLMPTPNGFTYATDAQVTAGRTGISLKFIGLGNVGDEAMQPWQPIPLNTPITAPQDGFVVASIDFDGHNGARGYIQGFQTLNNQWTVVAAASQHQYVPTDIIVPCNSFTMPVRRNVIYEVGFTVTTPAPVAHAYFVPLNPAVVQFGEFSARQPGRTYQALSDGFLMACLYQQAAGDRGVVDLFSAPVESELTSGSSRIASTSVHFYVGSDTFVPYNTATVPIPRNRYYTARFTITAVNPGLALWWIPLVRP